MCVCFWPLGTCLLPLRNLECSGRGGGRVKECPEGAGCHIPLMHISFPSAPHRGCDIKKWDRQGPGTLYCNACTWTNFSRNKIQRNPQFSSVQLLSHVWLFATPWITTSISSGNNGVVKKSFYHKIFINILYPDNLSKEEYKSYLSSNLLKDLFF